MQRLDPKKTAVVVVDVQDRLAAAMPAEQLERVKRSARILVEAARLLGARVLATEQYPKGLGATVPEVAEALKSADAPCFEKLDFSACDAAGFGERLSGSGVTAAVVLGMETHVCVYQTVRDLVARGLEVHVPIDGVASRREDHREVGLALCEKAGATRTTSETVVFDWLARASGDAFKQVSKLVR
ncbi:MAG: isochorismatase family protein [Polyangiaceae bacterium]|nr:isochorismatase family protein [Polyangiaceae bacterium]MCE7893703.1 isochorismatase family protein [Sorangiineae bacterium PRO1]MCL4754236.1 isochorismatase family protein [Myxococcales bacterium]